MQNDLKNIIESLLFVSDNPIDIRALKQIIPDADVKDIRLAIFELMAEYEERQGGFLLSEVAGGFQFRTRSDYKEWIKKLLKPSPVRLSKAALETLAIIAYHQPIIRSDVERIRGVDSGAILRGLLERKLIRILGKKEIPGRPLIYATTRRFLEIFNLKSLNDMPTLKEIQEFGKADAEELAAGLAEQQALAEAEAEEGAAPEPDGEEPETDAGSDVQEPETTGPESWTAAEDEQTDMPEQDIVSPETDESDPLDQEVDMTDSDDSEEAASDDEKPGNE